MGRVPNMVRANIGTSTILREEAARGRRATRGARKLSNGWVQVAMRRATAVAFAVALYAVLSPEPARSAERPGLAESKAFVEKVVDDAVRLWAMDYSDDTERLAAMDLLVHETFDIQFITRAVLGRYWRTLSASEKDEFGLLFPQFVVRIYLPHIARYSRDHLEVVGSLPRGKRDVVVKSRVRRDEGGEWIDTDWRIRANGDRLQVLDIVIAGVSLILVQRQEFESLIRQDGFASLVERLRERAEKAGSSQG